jgi:hypothetical protein
MVRSERLPTSASLDSHAMCAVKKTGEIVRFRNYNFPPPVNCSVQLDMLAP